MAEMVAYILPVLVTGVLAQLKTRIGKWHNIIFLLLFLPIQSCVEVSQQNIRVYMVVEIVVHLLPIIVVCSSIGKCNKFSFNANFQNSPVFKRLYLISVYLALDQTKLLLTIICLTSPFLKSSLIKNVIKMLIDLQHS